MLRKVIAGRLDHRRHLVLLGFAIASCVVTSRWRACLTPIAWFAVYGALHASTLVAALRGRQAVWRACTFVLAAAGSSTLTAALGFHGVRLAGALPGRSGTLAVLGIFAGLGAVMYAALIRAFGMGTVSARAVVAAALACPLAVVAAGGASVAAMIGRPYLTVSIAWWCAFSAVLCGFDRDSRRLI